MEVPIDEKEISIKSGAHGGGRRREVGIGLALRCWMMDGDGEAAGEEPALEGARDADDGQQPSATPH